MYFYSYILYHLILYSIRQFQAILAGHTLDPKWARLVSFPSDGMDRHGTAVLLGQMAGPGALQGNLPFYIFFENYPF